MKLSLSVEEINRDLENNETHIFQNKYFMYPLGSGTLTIIILISAICIFKKIKKQKIKKREQETERRRQEDAILY